MRRKMNESPWSPLTSGQPVSLRSIALPARLNVRVIGPHPDNFDEIGVTLRFLKEGGHSIRAVVCHTGSGVEDSFCSPPTLEVKRRLREQEQRDSLRFFGLPEDDLTFLELERDAADQPIDSSTNQARLAEAILPCRPDVVFLPHWNDTNSGHRSMYLMVSRLLRESRLAMTVCLLRDPKTISLRMDLYIPFGEDEARWKGEMLRFHRSQHQRNLNTRGHGFDERILATNRQIARELGLREPYAEAFEAEVLGVESLSPRAPARKTPA